MSQPDRSRPHSPPQHSSGALDTSRAQESDCFPPPSSSSRYQDSRPPSSLSNPFDQRGDTTMSEEQYQLLPVGGTVSSSDAVWPTMGSFRSEPSLHSSGKVQAFVISPTPVSRRQEQQPHTLDRTMLSIASSATSSPTASEIVAPHRRPEKSLTPAVAERAKKPSDSSTSGIVTRISIPKTHIVQFAEVLSSPPDNNLKIRKKSVRFNKVPLESTTPLSASSRSLRSDRDNPVMFSAIKFSTLDDNIPTVSTSSSPTSSPQHATRPIITHVSPSNNWASGDISNGSGFGKTSGALLPDNRDPDVKVAELMELKQMKIRQGDFLHLKDEIFQVSQALEEKQSILDEVSSERKALQSELHRYIAMVRQVQKDFELAQRAEAELLKDRDQLSLHLTQLKNHDFKILKDEVDQLRTAKGLRPLPSLEQEEAEVMGRYLEQRRGQWREEGTPTLVSSLLNGGSSGGEFHRDRAGRPSTAASSSSSSSAAAIAAAGATSRSSNRAQPSSSSTHASASLASTSTSALTSLSGRTTQQNHSKERQSYSHNRGSGSSSSVSAGKVRNHGSTSTAAPSSSSTTRTGSARLGRPSKSSSSRSQSPSPATLPSSSSSLRGERSKKRQRY